MTGNQAPLLLAHRGRSMEPALQEGDLLEAFPVAPAAVKIGDVIAFRGGQQNDYIVHRVTAVTDAGCRTRGDNCVREDRQPVPFSAVYGRVAALSRGRRRSAVAGGLRGRTAAGYALLRRQLAGLLAPAYRSFARLSPLPALLPRRWRPRVVAFGTAAAPVRRLLVGPVTAAVFDGMSWRVRRPFRLIVDERRLPVVKRGGEG